MLALLKQVQVAHVPCGSAYNVMQVMRALSCEAHIVHYLFCCSDLVEDAKLRMVQEMCRKFAAIVDRAARLASDPGEDDPLHSIASLYQARANSAPLSLLKGYKPVVNNSTEGQIPVGPE